MVVVAVPRSTARSRPPNARVLISPPSALLVISAPGAPRTPGRPTRPVAGTRMTELRLHACHSYVHLLGGRSRRFAEEQGDLPGRRFRRIRAVDQVLSELDGQIPPDGSQRGL